MPGDYSNLSASPKMDPTPQRCTKRQAASARRPPHAMVSGAGHVKLTLVRKKSADYSGY
jgi:hypothetical protein